MVLSTAKNQNLSMLPHDGIDKFWFFAVDRGLEGREDKTGYIDLSGNLAIPLPTALSASRFSEGFAYVIVREWDYSNETPFNLLPGPFIFIDRTGQNVFNQEFASAYRSIEGFARVTLPNNRHEIFINHLKQFLGSPQASQKKRQYCRPA